MKKKIITVAGYPGSGKSSTAKGVAATLGYEHFSSGDFFRKMAAEMGVSVLGINVAAEEKKEIDFKTDQILRELGERSNLVIDSRMAFHWIPESFKVFLGLDPMVAAERTLEHIQKEGRVSQTGVSAEEILEDTSKRVESERKRYQNLYNVDITDKKQFDLVVDTETNNLEKVIEIVVNAYREWLEENDES